MKKLRLKQRVYSAFKYYRLSAIFCIALCLCAVACRGYDVFTTWIYRITDASTVTRNETVMTTLVTALWFFGGAVLGGVIAESIRRKDKLLNVVIRIAIALICGALEALTYALKQYYVCAGILIALVCLIAHALQGKDNKSANLRRALSELLISCVVTGVLFIGLLIPILVFDLLFNIDVRISAYLYSIAAIIPFTTLMPFMCLGGLAMDDENYEAPRLSWLIWVALISYAVMNAVMLAYIVYILIIGEMPSGVIQPLALILMGAYALLRLILNGKENPVSRVFVKFGAYTVIPVFVTLIVAVSIRIGAYGLTEARIYGLAVGTVLAYVLISGAFRRRAPAIFIVAAIAAIAFTWQPLNAYTLARLNQETRLESALIRNEMTDENGDIIQNESISVEDKTIIAGAYNYLMDLEKYPADSYTAYIHSQAETTNDDGKVMQKTLVEMFGFTNPKYVTSSRRGYSVYGQWSSDELTTLDGFTSLKRVNSLPSQIDQNGDRYFTLGDDTVYASELIDIASEDDNLLCDTYALASGNELRVTYMYLTKEGDNVRSISLSGWLMIRGEK